MKAIIYFCDSRRLQSIGQLIMLKVASFLFGALQGLRCGFKCVKAHDENEKEFTMRRIDNFHSNHYRKLVKNWNNSWHLSCCELPSFHTNNLSPLCGEINFIWKTRMDLKKMLFCFNSFIHSWVDTYSFLFSNNCISLAVTFTLEPKKVARKFYYFHLKIHKKSKKSSIYSFLLHHNFKLQIFAILFWNW